MKIIYLFLFVFTFSVSSVASEGTLNQIQPLHLQEDFSQLYSDLKESHYNLFANVTQKAYDREFKRIQSELDRPLTRLQAQILFQQFVAFGKIAHANIAFPNKEYSQYRENEGTAFPIYVKIKENQWLISEDYSSNQLPKGTQITHINGKPVSDILSTLLTHISADTPEIASSLLEFQLPQYIWLLDQQVNNTKSSTNITVIQDGNPKVVTVDHISYKTLKQRVDSSSDEAAVNGEKLREYRLLSKEIAYLKPGPFYNAETPSDIWNNQNYLKFLNEAFEFFLSKNVQSLVIDVRNNPGGTNSFSDPLISWFADRPFKFASKFLVKSSKHAEQSNNRRIELSDNDDDSTSKKLAKEYLENQYGTVFEFPLDEAKPASKQFNGKVFVLIDRSSFSNAVSLAAIVKDYGFGKVIGEPTVDFATTYASIETFTLKNTQIEVSFPKAHIIRPSGDLKAGPVQPDLILKDVSFEKIVEILSEQNKKSDLRR